MARSLSRIRDQITRLQQEAAAIQNEVVDRVRKEIAKFGLTAEQLFGKTPSRRGAGPAKKAGRSAKYADGTGNTWAGMGPRPAWLRQALEAGQALEDFLVGKPTKPSPAKKASRKSAAVNAAPAKKTKAAPRKRAAAKKAGPAVKAKSRKPRAKLAKTEAVSS